MYAYMETGAERGLCTYKSRHTFSPVCLWMQSLGYVEGVWLPIKQAHMSWSKLKPVGYGLFWRAIPTVAVLSKGNHHDADTGNCSVPHGGAGNKEQILQGPL